MKPPRHSPGPAEKKSGSGGERGGKKTMTKEELKLYFQNLSQEEKEKIVNRIEKTFSDLWSEGFSLGMIEYFGDSILTRAKNKIEGYEEQH